MTKRSLWREAVWVLCNVLILLPGGSPARAEDTAPELRLLGDLPSELKLFESMPMVITAARKPQRITEASSTIDVIADEEIRHSGALTLTELLERLPGIYTPRAHNAQDMLWIRGVGGRYNDNALLLIDGVPYRSLYYSHFPINEQVPLEDIKRIEIIRGPGSALYGTGAFSGVINVITKHAADIKQNEVTVGGGTYDTHYGYALLRKEFEAGGVSFFAKYLDSKGYAATRDDEGYPSDLAREPESQYYRLQFRLWDFDLSVRYSRFGMNDFTAARDEEDEGGREWHDDFSTQLGYGTDLCPDLSLQVKAYLNSYRMNRTGAAFDEEGALTSRNQTDQESRVAGFDAFLTRQFSPRHTLLVGTSYEYEYLAHAWTLVSGGDLDAPELTEWASGRGEVEPESISNHSIGFYVEDELQLGRRLILTGGLRFDAFEAADSRWSPRLSAVYTPDEKTAVKLRYGEAFRAPTYQELYRRAADGEGEGSTDLGSQTIKTAEFEVSRFLGESHRVNVTVFSSQFDDFIKVVGDGDFENLARRNFRGLEAGIHGNLHADLSYFANYSFTDAEEHDGSDIGGVPPHMGNVGLTFTRLKYVDISPHVRLVGERNRPRNYQEDVPEGNRRDLLGAYGLLNLNLLAKNLPGPVAASLSFRNLLDTDYHTSGEQTEDYDVQGGGRRVLLSLSLLF